MQAEDSPAQTAFTESSTPEVELFAFMLVATYLVDKKACQQVLDLTIDLVMHNPPTRVFDYPWP